jgi:hypothetical protein
MDLNPTQFILRIYNLKKIIYIKKDFIQSYHIKHKTASIGLYQPKMQSLINDNMIFTSFVSYSTYLLQAHLWAFKIDTKSDWIRKEKS